jgi:hypothetical protein
MIMLRLTKEIPRHTKTYLADWCRKDYMEMSQTFRDIRGKSRNPMDKCFICKYPFEDGEMMAIASFQKAGNKTLCQDCADKLLSSEN